MGQVVQQLQLMGEVVYLKAEAQDLVVLDPAWLTHQQIGHLLSTQYAAHARVTGTVEAWNPCFVLCHGSLSFSFNEPCPRLIIVSRQAATPLTTSR